MTTKTELLKIIDNSITTEAYGVEFETLQERAAYCLECFNREFNNPYNKARWPSRVELVGEWLAGLPSVITVPYWNDEIVSYGYKLGMIPQRKTEAARERQEQKFIDRWFVVMAYHLILASEMKSKAA